jgi:hypothetical protein
MGDNLLQRMVSWGAPIIDSGLSFLKAIGIRVHTVRYLKIRKRIVGTNEVDKNEDSINNLSSREYKRIRGTFILMHSCLVLKG